MPHPEVADTLNRIRSNNWVVVLLRPLSKRPEGTSWTTTSDIRQIRSHIEAGGNIGLVCGIPSGVAVLDLDDLPSAELLEREFGPLPTTVKTGSGKRHIYVRWEPDLPARIRWGSKVVGEIQRGDRQQVVMPPSFHPVTRMPYVWASPSLDVITLPDAWRDGLKAQSVEDRGDRPDFIPRSNEGHPEEEPWMGPPVEVLLQKALEQPGARKRGGRVKFQCPGCRAEGRDRSKDNATVFEDGRWGCAVDRGHSEAIGIALGAMTTTPVADELDGEPVEEVWADYVEEN